jgi:hypothetical protein
MKSSFCALKRLRAILVWGGESSESLDRIMGKLDLKKKPEPEKKPDDK